MREILFRGKDPETGRWYEGFYMKLSDTTYCFKEDYDAHPDNTKHFIVFDRMTDWGLPNQHLRANVDPSTVGQYTGLTDKNGKKIFEGDIVRHGERISIIAYIPQYMRFAGKRPQVIMAIFNFENSEVIGNIHDNPELLEGL